MVLEPTTCTTHELRDGDGLSITFRPIDALRPDPANPRLHSRKQIRQLARSIRKFGFNVPVLIDRDRKVIAGHGRLEACRELGLRQVPTICLDHLDEAQGRAFMIADNRLTEVSSWDELLLGQQLKALSELDLDFSLELTGFEMGEIDLLIEQASQTPADDPDDILPEADAGPAVTRLGDLWLLGPHRVLCGSALEQDAFAALMGQERAAMVFTDPPYNVPVDGHVSGLGRVRHREFAMASGEMNEAEFEAFLTRCFDLLTRFSVLGSMHFVCMDWRHVNELMNAGRRVYAEFKNLCVWVKTNAGMGSLYRSQHELVFVFKHGQGRHQNNVLLGRHGRHRTNVWSYPGKSALRAGGEDADLVDLHPTVKPVALVKDAILDCSSRGGRVLDSFLGSGSTLIAAERTGRICHGLEIDPAYVDAAIRRWQRHTGRDALLARTGYTFGALQQAQGGDDV
jgi:DNA modification methylase